MSDASRLSGTPMYVAFRPLAGRRGLFVGLAGGDSIASDCARSASTLGARLVLACLNDEDAAAVAPLAAQIGAPLRTCNIERRGALEALVDAAAAELGGFDFVVHSNVRASRTELCSGAAGSATDDLLRAMRAACLSFAQLARLCGPHMPDGGALVTTSHFGADESEPRDSRTGPAKATFESIVRYLALELGPWGIRVHAVSHGPAPANVALRHPRLDSLTAHAAQVVRPRQVVGRDRIGDCLAFLVGPGGIGMTGRTLYVDACA